VGQIKRWLLELKSGITQMMKPPPLSPPLVVSKVKSSLHILSGQGSLSNKEGKVSPSRKVSYLPRPEVLLQCHSTALCLDPPPRTSHPSLLILYIGTLPRGQRL
jgi:hypothetical protein